MKFCDPLASTLLLALTIALPTTSHPKSNPRVLETRPPQYKAGTHDLFASPESRHLRLPHDRWTHPTPLQARSIMLNALDYLDNEWVGLYASIQNFLPIPAASTGLAQLYDQVYSHSLLTWVGNEPERNFLTMTVGFIQLQMRGQAGAAIPWVFVSAFAERLRLATRNGFCGGYTAHYANPTAGVGVVVTLTTVAMVAAAA